MAKRERVRLKSETAKWMAGIEKWAKEAFNRSTGEIDPEDTLYNARLNVTEDETFRLQVNADCTEDGRQRVTADVSISLKNVDALGRCLVIQVMNQSVPYTQIFAVPHVANVLTVAIATPESRDEKAKNVTRGRPA